MGARTTIARVAPVLAVALAATACSASRTVSAPVTAVVESTTAPAPPPTATVTTPTTVAPAPSTAAPDTTAATTLPATAPDTARSAAPDVKAAAWAVLDPATGELLGGHEVDTPRAVGSLMKLLTAHVVMAAGEPDRIVTAPERLLVSSEESAIGLVPGEQLPRDVLLRAMLIVSANDAARALAVDIAGSEAKLAEQMTSAAAELGLTGTRAANATGLDADGQHSTARDMVVLGDVLMADPEFARIAARTDAKLHGQTFPATNDLLSIYPGADGIKTGRTTEAGWCILASASRGGRRVIVAVLGAANEAERNAAASALLDWAFG